MNRTMNLQRAPRVRNPLAGPSACVSGGGIRISLPKRVREEANLGNRVLIYHNQREVGPDFLTLERTFDRDRGGFSCRQGIVSSIALAEVVGYVPRTTFVPVVVEDGVVSLDLESLRTKVQEGRR